MRPTNRLLLLFSTLTFVASAQTITGLSEYKIALSGSSTQLQIVNGGEHAIAGLVLAISFNHGGPPAPWAGMIVPGIIPPDSATHSLSIPLPGPDVTAIALDGVVLDNGTYVGPDTTQSFVNMQGFVSEAAAVASPLVSAVTDSDRNAAWTAITSISILAADQASFAKRSAAKILLGQRDGKGDAAALNAAQIYVKLAPLTQGK